MAAGACEGFPHFVCAAKGLSGGFLCMTAHRPRRPRLVCQADANNRQQRQSVTGGGGRL